MTNRERLFEILSNVDVEWNSKELANYLIEQGVTVQDKKSGDMLYDVFYNDDEARFKVCEFVITDISEKRIWFDNYDCYICTSDIGASVFLSREEAEAFADKLNRK